MKERSPGLVILFTIITCGVYNIYWFIVTTDEIEMSLQQKDGSVRSGGLAFVFALITCGIYYYYWYFKQGKRIEQLLKEKNLPATDNSIVYLLLTFFGLSIISTVLIQSDLNKYVKG